MVIGGYRVGPLLKSTGRQILEDDVPGLAAQTAYYLFFSLFPLLLFLTPLVGIVADERAVIGFVEGRLGRVVGHEALVTIRLAIESVVFAENAPGLMSTGAILAWWSGSNIFGALMEALNTAYDVREQRPWWLRQLLRLGMFLVSVVLMVIATVVLLGGEDVARWAGALFGISGATTRAWNLVQFPLAFVFIVLMGFATFYILPDVRQSWRTTLVAAVVTAILWLVTTLLFRIYVQNFANFDRTYGTIGGIIALLTWMYGTMFVVLSGGELAAELAHGTGAVRPLRGAIYNGRVMSASGPSDSSGGWR